SLAIVYQDEEPFTSLATSIRRTLAGQLHTETYPGTLFPSDPSARVPLLQEVFYGHRAVLFLGHHHRLTNGVAVWQLTSEDWMSMLEVHALIGGGRIDRASQLPRRTSGGVCVPEVVFASCCCGAWGEPTTGSRKSIFYPDLFLDAGVRFFLGTWMD